MIKCTKQMSIIDKENKAGKYELLPRTLGRIWFLDFLIHKTGSKIWQKGWWHLLYYEIINILYVLMGSKCTTKMQKRAFPAYYTCDYYVWYFVPFPKKEIARGVLRRSFFFSRFFFSFTFFKLSFYCIVDSTQGTWSKPLLIPTLRVCENKISEEKLLKIFLPLH